MHRTSKCAFKVSSLIAALASNNLFIWAREWLSFGPSVNNSFSCFVFHHNISMSASPSDDEKSNMNDNENLEDGIPSLQTVDGEPIDTDIIERIATRLNAGEFPAVGPRGLESQSECFATEMGKQSGCCTSAKFFGRKV